MSKLSVIDTKAKIGKNVKIGPFCYVGPNVQLGDNVELFPSHMEDSAWRFSFFGDEVEAVIEFDALTGEKLAMLEAVRIYANSHYITPGPTISQAIRQIKQDLKDRIDSFEQDNKLLEAQRIDQRTQFDIEMLEATGMCKGIENYSRYLTGRAPGVSHRPPLSSIFPMMPSCFWMKAMSWCHK